MKHLCLVYNKKGETRLANLSDTDISAVVDEGGKVTII